MTKIIHPYQLLEAPQVNILNNNIVEDVNYSYDDSEMEYGNILSQDIISELNPQQFSARWVLDNSEYNPTLYDVSTGTSPIYSFSFKFDVDTSNLHYQMNVNNINLKNVNLKYGYTYWKDFNTKDVTETNIELFNTLTQNGSSIIIGGKYERSANGSTETVWTGTLANISFSIVDVNKITFTVSMPNPRITLYDFDGQTVVYLDLLNFKFDIFANILKSSSIQVDTNSNLSLQSNELMQQNTKVNDTTQISEYIADDIKTHYADGKATIFMQVVDDGTQEYDVHDIVEPRIARNEFVTKIIENPTEETVGTSASRDMVFFNGKFIKVDRQYPNGLLYTSNNGKNWTFKTTLSNFKQIQGVCNGKLFVHCDRYILVSEDGVVFRKFADWVSTLAGGRGVFYKDGYYYMNTIWELRKVQEHDTDEYYNFEVVYTDAPSTTYGYIIQIIQFKNIYLFVTLNGYLYYSYDLENFTRLQLGDYSAFVSVNMECSNNIAFIGIYDNGFLMSEDGVTWTRVQSPYNTRCSHYFTYVDKINAFILYSPDGGYGAYKSFDDGLTWIRYNSGVFNRLSNYLISGNGILTNGAKWSQFYTEGYESIEYPLLTNADDTPKEFEITSSELVYDGLTYYNLEAVEST